MRFRGALIAALVLWCGGEALPQKPAPSVSISLATERSTFALDEPIAAKETITNRSDHPVTISYDVYHPGCPFDVRDEHGNIAADRKPGYRRGRLDIQELARSLTPEQLVASGALNGKLVSIQLKPRETWTRTYEVSSFFDMTKPGTYTISTLFPDPDSGASVASNVVRVTVKKPD